MTCREKLKIEHPKYIDEEYSGGCKGCPHNYGYLPAPDRCSKTNCTKCWDRVIPETEPDIDIQKLYNEQWERMAKIIEETVQKRDRSVTIFFSPETGMNVSVTPWPDTEEMTRLWTVGLISENDFRRGIGLSPIRRDLGDVVSRR